MLNTVLNTVVFNMVFHVVFDGVSHGVEQNIEIMKRVIQEQSVKSHAVASASYNNPKH